MAGKPTSATWTRRRKQAVDQLGRTQVGRDGRVRLAVRFAVLLVSVLLVTVGVYALWSNAEQQRASEQKVLEEARLLSQQMASSWDYVDFVQDDINYNADGRYDFKGIYCSVAGKSIALRFTQQTDCTIRYTRESPRTGSDAPDAFEAQALAQFRQTIDEAEASDLGASASLASVWGTAGQKVRQEFYGVSEYEGRTVFRYVSAIPITYGCLTCHGDPAGEYDETGYPKEGMELGDLAGAVSMVIPMEQYQQEAVAHTASSVLLFVALAVVIVACVSVALHRWVTRPLSRLTEAAREVGSGRFDTKMEEVKASGEIAALAREFVVMEHNLKDFYGQLEDQVRERTSQLAEANALLRRENEHQSSFLATMSHELRTPLASIIAYTDVWLRGAQDKSSEDVELMQSIKRNGQALLATINNTLDAASIEAQRLVVDVVPVDLLDVTNAVEGMVLPLARDREIDLRISIDPDLPLVRTDPTIVHKMLVNLVGNAIKFTDPGGVVSVGVELDELEERLVVTVSDTGIGIPEDDLRLIFERFRQADSSVSRKYGGSGLGLSLVKEMSELLGGSVSVQSAEGEGSVFVVRVPYGEVEG